MADEKKNENVNNEAIKDVLDIKKILPKRKNAKVLIFSAIFNKLKEDKLYLICFIITIIAFCLFSLNKLKTADGIFTSNDIVSEESPKKEVNDPLDEKLNLNNYIGVYVKSFNLEHSIKYNANCSISKYDLLYEVKKDNTINYYFNNDCVGLVLISSDTLSYVMSENTKNIGTKSDIYMFDKNKLTEVDGYAYKLNNKYILDNIVHNTENVNITFYEDKFVLLGLNELYLVNGKNIETEIVNDNMLLAKSFYKSVSNSNIYRYLIFNESEIMACYDETMINDVTFVDGESYYIYSITFNEDTLSFGEPELLKTRNKSIGCNTLNKDITVLGE